MKDYSKKIITIPNLLSMFRLILAVVFLLLFVKADTKAAYWGALGVLVLSAVTDVVDGKIARHFHMVSELGKILDPIADKVTQGFVMLALISRYPLMIAETIIFLIKECYMGIRGLQVIKATGWNDGALWFGKVNTVLLYGSFLVMILWYGMPKMLANALILLCCISIMICFLLYRRAFNRLLAEHFSNTL